MSHNPRHAVGITGLSHDFIRTTTVAITNAQVKTLPTTSIQLVPAHGSGKAVLPLAVIANRSFAAAAYTNIDGAATLTFGTADVDQVDPITSTAITTFLGGTATVLAYLPLSGAKIEDNAALVLRGSNAAAGAFTGGNAANALTVTVLFTVVDLV